MKNIYLVWIGIIAYWLFYVFEIITDVWFGSKFSGYEWEKQSISYLGQAGSPIIRWVEIWGVCFSVCLILFALGFHKAFEGQKWILLATSLLILYALGEGIGSGFFPINPPNTPITMDGRLHNIFGGIGDAGITIFPFILMLIFPKQEYANFHLYLWSVVGLGLMMTSFFLIAKFYQPDNFILEYKGVWQRIYQLNYHTMLLLVSFKMIFK